MQARFALRQYENPFRQKVPASTTIWDYTLINCACGVARTVADGHGHMLGAGGVHLRQAGAERKHSAQVLPVSSYQKTQ
jgi:hypothetical protein